MQYNIDHFLTIFLHQYPVSFTLRVYKVHHPKEGPLRIQPPLPTIHHSSLFYRFIFWILNHYFAHTEYHKCNDYFQNSIVFLNRSLAFDNLTHLQTISPKNNRIPNFLALLRHAVSMHVLPQTWPLFHLNVQNWNKLLQIIIFFAYLTVTID